MHSRFASSYVLVILLLICQCQCYAVSLSASKDTDAKAKATDSVPQAKAMFESVADGGHGTSEHSDTRTSPGPDALPFESDKQQCLEQSSQVPPATSPAPDERPKDSPRLHPSNQAHARSVSTKQPISHSNTSIFLLIAGEIYFSLVFCIVIVAMCTISLGVAFLCGIPVHVETVVIILTYAWFVRVLWCLFHIRLSLLCHIVLLTTFTIQFTFARVRSRRRAQKEARREAPRSVYLR